MSSESKLKINLTKQEETAKLLLQRGKKKIHIMSSVTRKGSVLVEEGDMYTTHILAESRINYRPVPEIFATVNLDIHSSFYQAVFSASLT